MHASNVVFGFLEIPFLILCIYFAFRTAIVLRGGIFGRGMTMLAWGFFVMAVGHVASSVGAISRSRFLRAVCSSFAVRIDLSQSGPRSYSQALIL